MKTLLIYKSETGFTKAYADMIKARIPDLTAVDLKHFKKKMVKENDIIFYGGPLRNNVIVGLSKFLKANDLFDKKDVFVFATGIQPIDEDKKENTDSEPTTQEEVKEEAPSTEEVTEETK